MIQGLISIIVPIYRAEKTLKKCVDSILSQTYQNIEIILVDDGSPDNCPYICDNYAKEDDRIRIIHKENSGVSDSRNDGIRIANGEYIGFVDSDDFIEPNMFETMYKLAVQNDVKIVECDYNIYSITYSNLNKTNDNVRLGLITGKEYFNLYFKNENQMNVSPWIHLWHSSIFEKHTFQKGILAEDLLFLFQVLADNYSVFKSDVCVYNYYLSENSITRSSFGQFDIDNMLVLIKIHDIVKKNGWNDVLVIIYSFIACRYYSYLVALTKYNKNDIIINEIKKFYKNNRQKIKNSKIRRREKFIYKINIIAPKILYCVVKNRSKKYKV